MILFFAPNNFIHRESITLLRRSVQYDELNKFVITLASKIVSSSRMQSIDFSYLYLIYFLALKRDFDVFSQDA